MELTPLADIYPSSNQLEFAPLPAETLAAGLTLEAGQYSLPESDLGIHVDSRSLLGEEKEPPPPEPAPAPPAPASKPTKIKLKPISLKKTT